MLDDAAREVLAIELDRDGLTDSARGVRNGSIELHVQSCLRAILAFAAQPQSREERVNVQTVLAYEAGQRNANASMRAHFAKMQDMARRYLEPNGQYFNRDGMCAIGPIAEASQFMADMIHMLDGPEQRAAFPDGAAPAALSTLKEQADG